MKTVKTYTDLDAWVEAMELTVMTYDLTKIFPKQETYGLISQMNRAAVSIPSNIAEGHARLHTKEYLYHLSAARGSTAELETQILLSIRLHFAAKEEAAIILAQTKKAGKLLNGLIRALRKTNH